MVRNSRQFIERFGGGSSKCSIISKNVTSGIWNRFVGYSVNGKIGKHSIKSSKASHAGVYFPLSVIPRIDIYLP